MAKTTTDGGSNKRKPIKPGAPGTKMTKQEVPFGGIGKAVAKGITKLAEKSAEKESIVRLANTKPVVKATKVVNKIATRNNAANNKKAVNAVADMQAKTKTEKIAKNSVLVKSGPKSDKASPLDVFISRDQAAKRAESLKSGDYARRSAAMAMLKQSKPAKVVKVNSTPAKSSDAAKAANAKALKAANKGKKK